jgi:hypothetical protein
MGGGLAAGGVDEAVAAGRVEVSRQPPLANRYSIGATPT